MARTLSALGGIFQGTGASAKTADLARKYAVSQTVATQDPIRGNARSFAPQKANEVASISSGDRFGAGRDGSLPPGLGIRVPMRRAVACRAFPAWGRSRQAPSSRRSEGAQASSNVDSLQLGSALCPDNGRSGARNDGGHLRVGRVINCRPPSRDADVCENLDRSKQNPQRLSSLGSKLLASVRHGRRSRHVKGR